MTRHEAAAQNWHKSGSALAEAIEPYRSSPVMGKSRRISAKTMAVCQAENVVEHLADGHPIRLMVTDSRSTSRDRVLSVKPLLVSNLTIVFLPAFRGVTSVITGSGGYSEEKGSCDGEADESASCLRSRASSSASDPRLINATNRSNSSRRCRQESQTKRCSSVFAAAILLVRWNTYSSRASEFRCMVNRTTLTLLLCFSIWIFRNYNISWF
jgi:hypothetical protein